MEKGRQRRPPRCRSSGPQAQAESPTTPTSRASFAPRSARPRLRDRSLDAAPGGHSDRALNRRALSPRPRGEDPARSGREPATSRQTSPRAQAGESAALTQTWPEIKKKLTAARPGSSSKTRAASHNAPPSAGPGSQRRNPGPDSLLQLVEDVDRYGARLSLGRKSQSAILSDP